MSAYIFMVERNICSCDSQEKKHLPIKEQFGGSIHFPNMLYEPLVRQPCQQDNTCSSQGFPFVIHLLRNATYNTCTLRKGFQVTDKMTDVCFLRKAVYNHCKETQSGHVLYIISKGQLNFSVLDLIHGHSGESALLNQGTSHQTFCCFLLCLYSFTNTKRTAPSFFAASKHKLHSKIHYR